MARPMDVSTASDPRTELRGLLKDRDGDFNVLIVGCPGSGKSTLINSMNMALAEKWSELAAFGSGPGNNTLRLEKIVMFDDKFMKENVEGYSGKVNFWDCAALANTDDKIYAEFIGLALDGKVPDKTTVFATVSDATVGELRDKFAEVVEGNRFNRLLFVCAADEEVPENLLRLIKKTTSPHKTKGRHIPVFLVMSKADRIEGDQRNYKDRKKKVHELLLLKNNKQKTTELTLYHSADDEQDGGRGGCAVDAYGKFVTREDIDKDLLILMINLLDPAYDYSLSHNENNEIEPDPPEQGRCPIF